MLIILIPLFALIFFSKSLACSVIIEGPGAANDLHGFSAVVKCPKESSNGEKGTAEKATLFCWKVKTVL